MSQWSMLRILLRVAIILLRSNHLSLEISIVMLPIIRILMQQTFWLGWKLVWWKGKLLQINWKHLRALLEAECKAQVYSLYLVVWRHSHHDLLQEISLTMLHEVWPMSSEKYLASSSVVIVSSSMSSCPSDCLEWAPAMVSFMLFTKKHVLDTISQSTSTFSHEICGRYQVCCSQCVHEWWSHE